MNCKIHLVVVLFIFTCSVFAQVETREQKIEELRKISSQIDQTQAKINELEEKRDSATHDILNVGSEDKTEAVRIGARAIRLFPGGLLENIIYAPDEYSTDFSVYSFAEFADYYFAPRLKYDKGFLQFIREENSFGYIVDLGGTLIETIDERNKESIALAELQLPKEFKDVKSEISHSNLLIKSKVPVIAGKSFLVRAFNDDGSDGIVAVKIHRKDSDSSIVIFVKKIIELSSNKPVETTASGDYRDYQNQTTEYIPDPLAKQEIENALREIGFYDLTVEATTTEITLRGTVKKGKMAEMMQIAMDVAKRKVNNQVTER